jgi:hypothetical protein
MLLMRSRSERDFAQGYHFGRPVAEPGFAGAPGRVAASR